MRLPILAALAFPLLAAASPRPWLPLDPGPARCAAGERATLEDAAIAVALLAADGHLRLASLRNGFTGRALPLEGELFVLRVKGGAMLPASGFRLDGPLACAPLAANPGASRAAERRPGVELRGTLRQDGGDLAVKVALSLRDGAAHVRAVFTLASPSELMLDRVTALDVALPGATVPGLAEGLPVVAGDVFLALEHPMASPSAVGGRASSTLRRALPLRAGVPATYAAVLGAAPAGQLRRGFAAYLEDERAHPFRTFLHYNSWYDVGYFTPYSEEDALRVIRAYGEELVKKRGAVLDSFLFDDGWDDTSKLWRFHAGFPRGFAPLRAAAAEVGAAPGMWLSPWGGYGPPREARLATAKAAGFEVDPQGLALSGPRYYPYFREAVLGLLREQGVNQLKLDGTGSPDKVTPGSAFDSDFAAAIALVEDLRAASPSLFVNLTTGTWPSPFWLRWADSIWRGGEDHAFLGAGTDRQRWITYRDADTYGGIVRQSPLFPLNALMLHGIIHARHARGLEGDPAGDLAAEVWTYFASGTGLQELYVSPDTLSPAHWDLLAAAARWARARADVLRDSHWVGGDPARGEPYGWASWSPERAVVALRNPGPGAATFTLEPAAALELPAGAPRRFTATVVFGKPPPKAVRADRPIRVPLAPHEVVVWELEPARQAP